MKPSTFDSIMEVEKNTKKKKQKWTATRIVFYMRTFFPLHSLSFWLLAMKRYLFLFPFLNLFFFFFICMCVFFLSFYFFFLTLPCFRQSQGSYPTEPIENFFACIFRFVFILVLNVVSAFCCNAKPNCLHWRKEKKFKIRKPHEKYWPKNSRTDNKILKNYCDRFTWNLKFSKCTSSNAQFHVYIPSVCCFYTHSSISEFSFF